MQDKALETYQILSETFTDEEIDAIVNDQVISEEFVRKIGKFVIGKLRNQSLINNMRYHSGWWERHMAGLHNTLHHRYAAYAARRESDRAFFAGKLGAQKKANPKSEWMANYREEMERASHDARKAEGLAQHHLNKSIEANMIAKQWKNAAINRELDDEANEVPARFVRGYMTGEPYSPNPSRGHVDYSMLPGHINRPAMQKGIYRPGIKVKQKRRKGSDTEIANSLHTNAPADSIPDEEKMKKVNESKITDIVKAVIGRKKKTKSEEPVQRKIEKEYGHVDWDSPGNFNVGKYPKDSRAANDRSDFTAKLRREREKSKPDLTIVPTKESIEIDYE